LYPKSGISTSNLFHVGASPALHNRFYKKTHLKLLREISHEHFRQKDEAVEILSSTLNLREWLWQFLIDKRVQVYSWLGTAARKLMPEMMLTFCFP
jgi:hypothetical protein